MGFPTKILDAKGYTKLASVEKEELEYIDFTPIGEELGISQDPNGCGIELRTLLDANGIFVPAVMKDIDLHYKLTASEAGIYEFLANRYFGSEQGIPTLELVLHGKNEPFETPVVLLGEVTSFLSINNLSFGKIAIKHYFSEAAALVVHDNDVAVGRAKDL